MVTGLEMQAPIRGLRLFSTDLFSYTKKMAEAFQTSASQPIYFPGIKEAIVPAKLETGIV